MKNFSQRGSTAYIDKLEPSLNYKTYNQDNIDSDDDDFYNQLNQTKSSKKKFTDIICIYINYFSLILTALYNIFWIFNFHKILPNIEENSLKNCPEIFNWNNYYYTWVIISLSKAFIFLLCAKVSTEGEFDCNIFCLILKVVSSLIPCIFFVYEIPFYGQNAFSKEKDEACFILYNNMEKFYRWETYYLIIIVVLLLIPIIGALAMAFKEYVKSLGEEK